MLQQLVRSLVDRRTGIIASIDYVPHISGGPLIHTYRGRLTHAYSFCDNGLIRENSPQVIVSGVGLKPTDALWSLFGEAAERYSSYHFTETRTITASLSEVVDDAIDPTEWIGFDYQNTPLDFPYKRFDPEQPIRWAWVNDLSGGAPKLVPAAHIWLRLGKVFPAENFVQRTSTGLGAGTSVQQAILSGLLELVERDAFSTRWLLSANPSPKTQVASNVLFLQEQLQTAGIHLELFDIAVHKFAPVTLAKLTLPEHNFGLCLGAGCAKNREDADMKAALEAYHILQGMLFWHSKSPRAMLPSEVRDFVDHGRYYSQPEAAKTIQWFFNGKHDPINSAPMSLPEGSDAMAIEEVRLRLKEQGFDSYYIDVTPTDIQEVGFVVVKVLVPGLQPLTCGQHVVADDRRRLDQVAVSLFGSNMYSINRALQPFA